MAEASTSSSRKRGRSAARTPDFSYRGAEPDPAVLAAAEDIPDLREHPLLSFAETTPAHTTLQRIIHLEPHIPRSFDWGVMVQLGIRARLDDLLNDRWRLVLGAAGPQYQVLTLEFFSTFEHRLGTLDDPHAIVFSLGRRLYHMSIAEFAVRMGLYTAEEVTQPIFTESLRGVFRAESDHGVTAVQLASFWTTIADGHFVSSTPASQIRDPLYRFLHRVIACTIIGRFMGIEKVNTLDLLVLYCIIQHRSANVATIMLASLSHPRGRGEHARLAMGSYVARLAQSLDVFTTWPARVLYESPAVVRIPYADMQQMGVCPQVGPPRLVDARAPPPIPAELADDPGMFQPVSPRVPAQSRPRALPRTPPPSTAASSSSAPPPATLDSLRDAITALSQEQAEIREQLAAQRAILDRIVAHFQIPPP